MEGLAGLGDWEARWWVKCRGIWGGVGVVPTGCEGRGMHKMRFLLCSSDGRRLLWTAWVDVAGHSHLSGADRIGDQSEQHPVLPAGVRAVVSEPERTVIHIPGVRISAGKGVMIIRLWIGSEF